MTPKEFKAKYFPFALKTQEKTGIDAYVVLAQSALETGWGEHAPGNMMFGVKDSDGINGNEQLVKTFEYSRRFGLTAKEIGLYEIQDVKPVMISGERYFKYIGTAFFRKYDTPEESFTDHCSLFFRVKKYGPALAVKSDPEKFVRIMAPIYAQSPTYADTIISIMKTLKEAT